MYGPLLVTLALVLSCSALAEVTAEWREGLVVSVHDGDTLTVLIGKQQLKVRLAEVDAPELRQPFGQRSRQSLAAICFHETAKVELIARDRYGRSVGKVQCSGKDAGRHQVSSGMAWVYERYAPKDSPLYGVQAEARSARLGLWADAEPIPPWEWRKTGRDR
jgi:endonuclease YncB( thermonuclease family)